MKGLILTLFTLFLSTITLSQVDTVCFGTNIVQNYSVQSLGTGYTYTWSVLSPGIITTGQGTNSISINWSGANPGLINGAISVFATSPDGCQSQPVTLNVLIYQIVPNIVAVGPFCPGANCVSLTGEPSGGTFTGTGVVGNQFCPTTSGTGNFPITYTVTSSGCVFTTTSTVNVTNNPTLSPIQF
jgi:hypothetical protein